MNQVFRLVDLVFGVCHDQTVQVFFLVAGVSSVRSALALLDRAFTTDRNLRAGFRLHLLQSVTTGSNKQTD